MQASAVAPLVTNYTQECSEPCARFRLTHGIHLSIKVPQEDLAGLLNSYADLIQDDETTARVNPESGDIVRDQDFDLAEDLEDCKSISFFVAHRFQFESFSRQIARPDKAPFIRKLVWIYQRAIAELMSVSPDQRELIAVVTESPIVRTPRIATWEISLYFPYLVVSNSNATANLIRTRAIELIDEHRLYNEMNVRPSVAWNVIVQPINHKVRFLYRSTATPTWTVHTITHYFRGLTEAQVLDPPIALSLKEIFKPMDHSWLSVDDAANLNNIENLERWKFLLLMASWCVKITPLRPIEVEEIEDDNGNCIDPSSDDPQDICENLLPLISANTLKYETYWMDIGRAIHTSFYGSDDGLELWIKTSSKVNIEDRSAIKCREMWPTFSDNPLTVKTIAWFARIDSKDEYDAWHKKWFYRSFTLAIDLTDQSMADVVYRYFWLDYMCSDIKRQTWWYFCPRRNRLIRQDDAYVLRKAINTDLETRFKVFRSQIAEESHRDRHDSANHKVIEEQLKAIGEVIKLYRSSYKLNSIIKMVSRDFYVPNFQALSDSNEFLTGWTNCIVEVTPTAAVARSGKPEDYITKSGLVGWNNYTENSPPVVELRKYLTQVFPDEDLLDYTLKNLASFLRGRNCEKAFRVWTGDGDNSKSVLIRLLQACFGQYVVNFPVAMFTESSRGSGPTPELAQAQGARAGIVAEPDEARDLKAGSIKRDSGGDSFFARFLHSDGGSIRPTHKTIYMCNAVPNVPMVDMPTKKRFLFTLFLSTFCDDAPESEEEQRRLRRFPKDLGFDSRIPELAKALLWILVKYYAKYVREGILNPPAIIRQYTEDHWRENDIFYRFSEDELIRIEVEPGTVPSSANSLSEEEVYKMFKPYWGLDYPSHPTPTKPIFVSQMIGRIGKPVNRRWIGFTRRQVEV